MSAPLVIVLFVATGDAREASTQALTTTAQDSLDRETNVIVREIPNVALSDKDAVALGGSEHADAVVLLTWPDDDHRRAHVHLYAAHQTGWIDRDMRFGRADPPEERGRMLGFEIASMLPREGAEAPATPETFPAPHEEPKPASPREKRIAVDLAAQGSTGIGGRAGGLGAELGGGWRIASPIWVRVEIGARIGEVAEAQADASTIRFGGGIAARFAEISRFELGARGDMLVLRHALARTDNPSSGAHWLPGADALIEGAFWFAPDMGLVAATGAEVAFGTTRILVDGARVGTIPPLRGLFEGGVRARF
jgi:hypothetical protein